MYFMLASNKAYRLLFPASLLQAHKIQTFQVAIIAIGNLVSYLLLNLTLATLTWTEQTVFFLNTKLWDILSCI